MRQCCKCPWKKSVNPHEIPNGYSVGRHKNLKSTIARPGLEQLRRKTLRAMACHETHKTKEQYCVGWLHHQLGPGNNLALRIKMLRDNFPIELDGDQHESFEDTLPKDD